jgi:hypothetical protein
MSEVELRRQSGELHTPLGFTYPYAVGVPLSSYLLHQDAIAHQSLEFDRQTAALVGSNEQMAGLLGEGLREARQELRDFGDEMAGYLSETNDRLESIDQSLDCIAGHLVVVEAGIDRLTVAVREGTDQVTRSIGAVSAQLSELNQSAARMARMMKDGELTWALEQARTAARAMRVGDLETAETAATRALNGGGGHVGAPTHVIFMLQLAEILIRQGEGRIADAGTALDRAERYLAIDPSEDLKGRYHFARGSHLLARAQASGDRADLVAAESAFRAAIAVPRYAVVATMWKAVADTRLGVDSAAIGEALAALVHARPWCAIEILRLQSEGLNAETVEAAIRTATSRLYRDAGDTARYRQMRQRADAARAQIEGLSHTRAEYGVKGNHLKQLVAAIDVFTDRFTAATAQDDLAAARALLAQKAATDARLTALQIELESA